MIYYNIFSPSYYNRNKLPDSSLACFQVEESEAGEKKKKKNLHGLFSCNFKNKQKKNILMMKEVCKEYSKEVCMHKQADGKGKCFDPIKCVSRVEL